MFTFAIDASSKRESSTDDGPTRSTEVRSHCSRPVAYDRPGEDTRTDIADREEVGRCLGEILEREPVFPRRFRMGEPLDPVSGDFRHETWGSPSAVEPAEYAPPSLLERSGPPRYAPGVLPTHEETSEPSNPNFPIYAFLFRDRRALCIQHELGKLSAAEDFNRSS
ncbi:hypothetical protein [Haloferax gibbonsii]|uniref:hypothetical protein n=1 Tax=Haloferax gibbonsii TaxID=35746 RepID=UPI0012E2A586|nr:hypothetical protein [Haloferax gibbonsii]